MINKNKLFRQAHIYISLFFLPLAFLYAVTGFAYIVGFDDDSGARIERYVIQDYPSSSSKKEILLEYLNKNNIKIPSTLDEKKTKSGDGIQIGGVHYSASIVNLGDNNYEVMIKERSLLGDLIMLHKDKGMWYFSVLGLALAAALIILYISGILITLVAIRKDRNKQILTLVIGFLVTFVVAYASL